MLLLTVVGSTGLFLYGMKLISESIQKIAGEKLRVMLSSMSSNRVWGVFTGVFITALVQSSSATSVMVVSFVNAGLIRLIDAIAIIMGANIGTTLTAWIISLAGYQFDFMLYSLPLIGIGIPFLFSNNRKLRNWGEVLLGFSLLVISLTFIQNAIPNAKTSWLKSVVDTLIGWRYLSILVFFALGALFTIIIKSSSAILR
jgi:phosphate:Na+ symporter